MPKPNALFVMPYVIAREGLTRADEGRTPEPMVMDEPVGVAAFHEAGAIDGSNMPVYEMWAKSMSRLLERPFVDETQILQRELKDDVPGYLATIAYSIVGLIALAIIVLLGWVLTRLGRPESGAGPAARGRRLRPRPSARPGRVPGRHRPA